MRLIILFVFVLALTYATNEKKVVCNFKNLSIYQSGKGKFKISNINPTLCTHLVYNQIGITNQGNIKIIDRRADLSDDLGMDGFNRFNQLREKNPWAKTLVSMNGWNEGNYIFSKISNEPYKRMIFVDNIASFIRKYGFDGLDLEWEINQGKSNDDKIDNINGLLLLEELRKVFDEIGLLLTITIDPLIPPVSLSYDVKHLFDYVDFINLMTYGYHTADDNKTGMNAPLYFAHWENENERGLNVNESVHYWLSQGVPKEKLVVGFSFYGRTFTLVNEEQSELGSPSRNPGIAGPYSRQEGILGYNEICEMQLDGEWDLHYEEEQRVPYAAKSNQWVGYDNPMSIKEKAEFVKLMDLGGAMIRDVHADDFLGICGEQYPLLKITNSVLREMSTCF